MFYGKYHVDVSDCNCIFVMFSIHEVGELIEFDLLEAEADFCGICSSSIQTSISLVRQQLMMIFITD